MPSIAIIEEVERRKFTHIKWYKCFERCRSQNC